MDFSKLERLPQVKIGKPCPENWDAMDGDEQSRFCAGCQLSVHNIAEMSATEAEALLSKPERVCVRLTVDNRQSVLTRDGWIPRLLLAGAVAATVAGCGHKEVVTASAPEPPVAASTPVVSSGPTPFEVLEDKVMELYEEVKEAIFPGSRPTTVLMGDFMLSPSSGGSTGPSGP